MKNIIDRLEKEGTLNAPEFLQIIECNDRDAVNYLYSRALAVKQRVYGNGVFIRGLIEFTNYCKNNCYYCGIRCGNTKADRYRLSKEQILDCTENGYSLGFRTFVLQGGEDSYFTDEIIEDIVKSIKASHPDCAVTLSIGEKSFESYKKYFDAGADRYLLREETANREHYSKLHPSILSSENRKQCLFNLKKIGFQTGCGFMVGSPYQTSQNIIEDLYFIKELQPEMVGIGPFIPHKDTPFAKKPAGSMVLTLKLLSIIRLMLPNVLLPATTALNTIHPNGREYGILAGANVVMPNLSPADAREKYLLYNNKSCSNDEAAENLSDLKISMRKINHQVIISRGDYKK